MEREYLNEMICSLLIKDFYEPRDCFSGLLFTPQIELSERAMSITAMFRRLEYNALYRFENFRFIRQDDSIVDVLSDGARARLERGEGIGKQRNYRFGWAFKVAYNEFMAMLEDQDLVRPIQAENTNWIKEGF